MVESEALVDLGLFGVPAWRTSLSPTGAHATPAAIREALLRFSTFGHGIDIGNVSVVDFGDVEHPDGDAGETRVRQFVERCARKSRLLVALGGDNSITYPVALGAYGRDRARAGLITLDAHHDVRDGTSNGSPVRRLLEAGVHGSRIVQVGIADFANSPSYSELAAAAGITTISRSELGERGTAAAVRHALNVAGGAGGPIHVDIDVDVCDRSVAPGCPASLPGGISAHELRSAAFLLAADPRVTSIDIVEVDATRDADDERTVRLAALCVLDISAGLASRPPTSPSI